MIACNTSSLPGLREADMSKPDTWDPDEIAQFVRFYEVGVPEKEMLRLFPGKTVGQFRGKAINMQLHRSRPTGAYVLAANHPAVVRGRTMYPESVRDPRDAPELLPSGRNQRKLGTRISKGPWAGFRIFSLTLEERATCPSSCHAYRNCMGNGMQFAARNAAGPALERLLSVELGRLQRTYPAGFAVRLHVLGDFYSVDYVAAWEHWLDEYPALHVFGYTARDTSDPIGAAVLRLAKQRWDRFAIRLSSPDPAPERAITLWEMPNFSELKSRGIIVCPAELGKTKGGGSCALCWSPAARNKTIAFLAHGGRRGRKSNPEAVASS